MKTWKIPVCWQEMGVIEVKAPTLAKAIEIAKDEEGVIPLPDDGYYVDGSWEVSSTDEELLRACYNDNKEDQQAE